MSNITILFESVEAAKEAFTTLKPMIDAGLDCNALTFDEIDGELVKWLISDCYYQAGAKKRNYPYPVSIISKSDKTTLYQYQDLQIEQKFIPPADWEFTTRDCEASRRHRSGRIINSTWWGYEDGSIDIGFYIENLS